MQDFFSKNKRLIAQCLADFFTRKKKELSQVNHWGSDLCDRYLLFSGQGKMIRGCLTILGYEMYTTTMSGKKVTDDVIEAAAAMELFQSSLLIHDDIMDRDTTRRDMDTVFTQYQKLGEKQNILDSYHFGQSMGICAGDIGFFFAFELLADTPQQIHILVAKELTNVGIAQMQDVSFGHQTVQPNEATLVSLYRYKTARYTFSLPLMIGATLAGQSKKTLKTLEELGEKLGIIFQLKDDELDVEGDMREQKKTLMGLYGKKRTQTMIFHLSQHAERLIAELPIDKKWQQVLLEFLEYNVKRSK